MNYRIGLNIFHFSLFLFWDFLLRFLNFFLLMLINLFYYLGFSFLFFYLLNSTFFLFTRTVIFLDLFLFNHTIRFPISYNCLCNFWHLMHLYLFLLPWLFQNHLLVCLLNLISFIHLHIIILFVIWLLLISLL